MAYEHEFHRFNLHRLTDNGDGFCTGHRVGGVSVIGVSVGGGDAIAELGAAISENTGDVWTPAAGSLRTSTRPEIGA